MSEILAIDQSTSATKALLYDVDGRLLNQVAIEHHQIYPRPGWVEHDAEEIWTNTLAALKILIDGNRDRMSDVICLSITNQRETFVVFDRGSGKPLHHAIVWQCRRGEPVCGELTRGGHGELVARKTGLKIDTYFSGPKITWLLRNHPEIATRVRDGEALVGTIDAYLIYRLSGGEVLATDHTNA